MLLVVLYGFIAMLSMRECLFDSVQAHTLWHLSFRPQKESIGFSMQHVTEQVLPLVSMDCLEMHPARKKEFITPVKYNQATSELIL